ncbi:cd38 molecule [Mactra antiquata]
MEIQTVKAGWLHRKSSVLHRWKKNWFVLDRSGELIYFENQDKHEPEGRLMVRAVYLGIFTAGQCDFNPPEGSSKSCLLLLKLRNDEDLKLCAESPDDLKAWQLALDEARSMTIPGSGTAPPGAPIPAGAQVVYPQSMVYRTGGYGYGGTVYTTPGQYVVRNASGNGTVVMGNQAGGQVVCVQDPHYYRSTPYLWGPVFWCSYGGQGTTLNIQQIFLGRCFEYQELPIGRLTNASQDCQELWRLFSQSWTYKDPNSLTRNDYRGFIAAAEKQTFPVNKTLLWSGTFDIAHEYSNSGRRYITLEDSLIGYIVNGLTWCGKKCSNCDGINYETCPDWWTQPPEVKEAFWGGLSEAFARGARGEVRLLLSGTNPNRPAYTRDSYFAKHELLSLPTSTNLLVILANDVDKTVLEHCGTETLLDLQHDVLARGLGFVCIENPDDILHLMCVNHVASQKCVLQFKQGSQPQPIG